MYLTKVGHSLIIDVLISKTGLIAGIVINGLGISEAIEKILRQIKHSNESDARYSRDSSLVPNHIKASKDEFVLVCFIACVVCFWRLSLVRVTCAQDLELKTVWQREPRAVALICVSITATTQASLRSIPFGSNLISTFSKRVESTGSSQ